MSEMKFLGTVRYAEGRAVQDEYVRRRVAGDCPDTFLFCEHPPTITLGRRTKPKDIQADDARFREIEIVEVDRGGGPTYHGPGQLVLYPVLSLREHGFGVRRVIDELLGSVAHLLNGFGLSSSEIGFTPPGIWWHGATQPAKIASIGLRIISGVTNHGVALNVKNNLVPFSWFSPCGMENCQVTSLAKLLPQEVFELSEVSRSWYEGLVSRFDT